MYLNFCRDKVPGLAANFNFIKGFVVCRVSGMNAKGRNEQMVTENSYVVPQYIVYVRNCLKQSQNHFDVLSKVTRPYFLNDSPLKLHGGGCL